MCCVVQQKFVDTIVIIKNWLKFEDVHNRNVQYKSQSTYRMMYVCVHLPDIVEVSVRHTLRGIELSGSVEQYVEIEFSWEQFQSSEGIRGGGAWEHCVLHLHCNVLDWIALDYIGNIVLC